MEKSSYERISHQDIRSFFDIGKTGQEYPHSIYDESLSFDKKHTFSAYKKEKTIDQFTSAESGEFFKITRKPEIQFLTSQLLGGVLHASPIYINEDGEYFSKKVSFPENMLDAAAGLFILNVVANDWDHEIPYDRQSKNYENGSFFDFSQSKIALEEVQRNEDEKTVAHSTQYQFQDIERKLTTFAESKEVPLTQKQVSNELKQLIISKLNSFSEFISSEDTIKELYEKIGYFEKYQNELLDPKELQSVLLRKVSVIITEMEKQG